MAKHIKVAQSSHKVGWRNAAAFGGTGQGWCVVVIRSGREVLVGLFPGRQEALQKAKKLNSERK